MVHPAETAQAPPRNCRSQWPQERPKNLWYTQSAGGPGNRGNLRGMSWLQAVSQATWLRYFPLSPDRNPGGMSTAPYNHLPLSDQLPVARADEAGAARWFLSGQTDAAGPIRRIAVDTTPFVIGRGPGAALCVDSRSVSKSHAELLLTGDELWLRDLNSTNGTYVNGERIGSPTRLSQGDLVQFATLVFRLGKDELRTMGNTSAEIDVCDQALAMMQFDRLIHDGGVVPFFQPIVGMQDRRPVAYEVLGRSRLFGLNTPAKMFSAAAQLNQVTQLSDVFRTLGVDTAANHGLQTNLFLNTHPDELDKDGLVESLSKLRQIHPEQAMTLEVHEKAVTDCHRIHALRRALRDLNIQLAFDDFGEGQTRLVELSEVRPDFLKFDMGLTRSIHAASADRQTLVSRLAQMVNELGIVSLAEGVEDRADHDILAEMGFRLGQGFYYGRPAPIAMYARPSDE